ncbi:MAG: TetR/AcrR family transcriptional regulator [Planctomycetota bacterium]|nr:TetR/AcrR family transcriptional regulator [Planctomycetota bacterium]
MATLTRKPSSERREEIVLAVLRIIGERGLTSLSTSSLAEEVGVTTGALFRHFHSREEILAEVVRHALARIEETFPGDSLPPLERLRQLAINRVRLLSENPGLSWLLRSEQAYLELPEASVELLRDAVKRSRRFLLDALREGAQRGEIRDDIEPELLLVPILGTIHALAGSPGLQRHSARDHQPDRIISALLQMLAPSQPTTGRKHRRRQGDNR